MPEREKFGVRSRPFSDSLVGVPFKKRHILFTRSPSPPPQLASPQPRLPLAAAEDCGVQCKPESLGSKSPSRLPFVAPEDCDVQHKPESSESPLSKSYSHPVQVDAAKGNISAVTGKEVSSKSREEPKNGDLNPVGKPDTVLVPNDPGLSLKVVGNSTTGADTKEDMVLIDKVGSVMGSVELLSVMQDTLGMPVKLGSDEGKIVQSEPVKMRSDEGKIVQSEPVEVGSDEAKIVQSEGILVKRENIIEKPLLSKHSTAELKIDVGHFSLSRSNWDLNTPMDTWEGSKTDSNSGTIANGRLELGEIHKKVLDSGLEQSLYKEPSVSNVTLGNCNVQTDDQEFNLFNQCTLMREHTSSENSLDLHFKPSFLSNCTTSANFQCLREKPFLSLSMKPMTMVSSHSPQLVISRVVKSEHYESRCKESRKVYEMGDLNSLGMKHVKSEPYEGHEPFKNEALSDLNSVGSVAYEGHETSQTNVLSDLNSVGSVAVKLEPLEDHSQGCSRSPDGRSFSMEKVGHALSLQSMDMHQRAGKFDGSSGSKCKSPESKSLEGRSVLMELGGHSLSLQSAEVLQNAHKFDSKTSHLTCMSSRLDESMLRSDPQNHSTHIPEYSNEMVSEEVKPEPLEDQSQGCSRSFEGRPFQVEPKSGDISHESTEMHEKAGNADGTSDKPCKCTELKSVEGKSLQIELGGYGLSLQSAEVLQDAGKVDGKTSDLTCKSPELDVRTLHSVQDPSTDISEYSNDMGGKDLDVGNQDLTSINGFSPDSVSGDPAKETVTKASDLVLRPIISDGNESNPVKELCQTDDMPLPSGSLASDSQEHMTTDGLSKSTQMDSFGSSQIDEPSMGQYENCKVLECDEIKNMTDTSPETLDKLCEFEFKADISHVVSGAISTLRKQSAMNHEDFEDGEVRDPALASSVEGPVEQREDKQAKDSGLISSTSIEVSLPIPSLIVEEISMQNSMQVECDMGPCDNEDGPNFASIGVLNVDSGENQPSKTIREISKDNLKKPERNSKSDAILSTDTDIKGCLGDVSNQQENAEGSHLMSGKISELFKTEPSENNGAAKDVTDRGQNSRIIYLSSSYNKLASEKMKSDSGWSRSSQIQRENTSGRPFKQDKSRSWGSRDESSYDKSRKFQVERRPFHQAGKHVTGFECNRSRADDQLIPLHGNKDTDSDQFLEHTNSLIGDQFHRRVNNSEISAWDGSNRMTRKPRNEQIQNLSHMPCRGRPPERRGQVMLVRHPFRGNSPGRSEREIPDFVLAHGENLMRNLPDGMIDPPIPSHPHSQYERADGSPRRRGTGLRLPVNGPNSFSRAQRCSPRQWTAPGRSPDGYTGPPELVRRRSPQVIGLGRMRSPPQQRPCFPEDMIVRRHGSPPYVTRLPDDVMGMVPPARERDFPRQTRGPNRNMQRFNWIDRRESAEEYFGPPQHGQIREYADNDDYADDRRMCDERPGPIHSFRQHCVTGDDDGKRFHFHADDGPPRPFRVSPETADRFCEAGSPRDFNGRFRNRLGNASGRLRGILGDQDDDYRHHEDQGWHDAGFGEVRMKRRRF